MISLIDEALRTLVRTEALEGAGDVEVVLDAPTKDWAARRNAPTVNMYLYDLREDLRRRASGLHELRAEDGQVTRVGPPRYFKMSYLVSAWTQRPEDEHRLLAGLLNALMRYDVLPPHIVPSVFPDNGLVVPITVGLPPPEDRAFADVWTALGGELKPSLDLVVIAPLEAGLAAPAGPPVREGLYVGMTDTLDGGTDERRQQHLLPDRDAAATGGSGLIVTAGQPRARRRGSSG